MYVVFNVVTISREKDIGLKKFKLPHIIDVQNLGTPSAVFSAHYSARDVGQCRKGKALLLSLYLAVSCRTKTIG